MRHNVMLKTLILLSLFVFILNLQASFAQQSVSEETAADEVAEIVGHICKQNRLPRIRRIVDRRVREDACFHAKQGGDSHGGRLGGTGDKVGTLSVLWYSTVDPDQLKAGLVQLVKGPDQNEQPRRFAVGACFVAKNGSTNARYLIEVRTYMGAVKSFFYRAVWD